MSAPVRVFAVVAVAGLAVSGVAAADPVTDHEYYVVNNTEFPIKLVSYLTGNPYPEYVRPEVALPDGTRESKVKPGEKFTIGVRDEGRNVNIKINFDTYDKQGKQIPGGMVELQATIQHGGDISPGVRTRQVACWPGPNRSCTPRGWGDGSTVTFTG